MKSAHFRILVLAVLASILVAPMLIEYFTFLHKRVYYRFWPVLAVTILGLFWMRWRKAPKIESGVSGWISMAMLVLAMLSMLLSLLYYIPWWSMLSWVILMGVLALVACQYRKVNNLLGIWSLWLILLRPPYGLTQRFMVWIETVSSSTASLILDYLGVIHNVQGNIIDFPNHHFGIDLICSGRVSVVCIIAIAAVVSVSRNRSVVHCVLSLLLAVLSAWLINTMRILAVCGVKLWYNIDLLSGFYSVFFQVLSLLIVLMMILNADSLLVLLFGKQHRDVPDAGEEIRSRIWLSRMWIWISTLNLSARLGRFKSQAPSSFGRVLFSSCLICLVGLMILEGVVLYHRSSIINRDFMHEEQQLAKISKQDVAFDRKGWKLISFHEERRDYESDWGAFSSIWKLEYNNIYITMAIDYPFDEWHDVKRCYRIIGWKIVAERIENRAPDFQWAASETDMILPSGEAGFVLCSHCDHLGNTVKPKPTTHGQEMFLYRLHPNKMTPPFGSDWSKGKRTFYQTQCMVTTPLPLDELTKEEIRNMYASFREQTRRAIAERGRAGMTR